MVENGVGKYFDKFFEIQGSLEFDPIALKQLLCEIESDSSLTSSDKDLLRGYLAYQYPEVLDKIDFEKEFIKVLENDPTNVLAREFLGYTYFDIGKYEDACSNFEKVDLDKLFTWASIKVSELIVCCYLEQNHFDKAYELMIPVLNKALECKTADYAWPTELVNSLVKNRDELLDHIGTDKYRNFTELLDAILEKHQLKNLFKDQIQKINYDFC